MLAPHSCLVCGRPLTHWVTGPGPAALIRAAFYCSTDCEDRAIAEAERVLGRRIER
jgi:hypothetical protein